MRPESGSPYSALAMRYSCVGSKPHTSAMWGSRVVMIQSASSGSGALRYADLMSIVAILNLLIVASCRKREKVSGMMVGLYVIGSWAHREHH